MKPIVKGFVIGCSILFVAAVAAVVGVVWFLNSKKDVWVAKGMDVRTQAAKFGQNVSEPKCVEEAMSRYRATPGIMGALEQRIWLGGCLEASVFESGFCQDVPPKSEVMRSATWNVSRCADLGFKGDSNCPNIITEVQTYCEGPERKKKSPPGT